MNKTSNKKNLVLYILVVIIILFGINFIINKTPLRDKIKSLSFEASPKISKIEQSLGLTDKAKTIFRASYPSLDEKEDFNLHCSSYDPTTAILGCYSAETIYIYNIESEELSGIIESTAAHELLHAVWDRLSGSEKIKLTEDLEKAYEEKCDELCETVEAYSDSDRNSEIYARIGTQIKNLPQNLEDHYANYFINRSKIVEFYDSYSFTFDEIRTSMDELYSEIEALSKEVEELNSKYDQEIMSYEKSVQEFNACARTANCFDERTFKFNRNNLISKYNQIQSDYNNLDAKVNEYNAKISEYNANILHAKNLENIINSNSVPAEI